MTDLSIIEDDDASYLSIDQILMEEQKLTCQSRYNFLDLDFRRAKEDLNVGKKIELPLWLASQLGEFVLHDIPKQYRTKFQDILASDPEVVNLHREGPKYYGMGLRLATNRLDFADNEDIIKLCNTLLQAYSRRISWIGDQANGENKIESRLDDMEKNG